MQKGLGMREQVKKNVMGEKRRHSASKLMKPSEIRVGVVNHYFQLPRAEGGDQMCLEIESSSSGEW